MNFRQEFISFTCFMLAAFVFRQFSDLKIFEIYALDIMIVLILSAALFVFLKYMLNFLTFAMSEERRFVGYYLECIEKDNLSETPHISLVEIKRNGFLDFGINVRGRAYRLSDGCSFSEWESTSNFIRDNRVLHYTYVALVEGHKGELAGYNLMYFSSFGRGSWGTGYFLPDEQEVERVNFKFLKLEMSRGAHLFELAILPIDERRKLAKLVHNSIGSKHDLIKQIEIDGSQDSEISVQK